jgi:hypothetical protein
MTIALTEDRRALDAVARSFLQERGAPPGELDDYVE